MAKKKAAKKSKKKATTKKKKRQFRSDLKRGAPGYIAGILTKGEDRTVNQDSSTNQGF